MTPDEYGVRAATTFNANSPAPFPGRPLFEGVVARAVEEALAADRASLVARINSRVTELEGKKLYHPDVWLRALAVDLGLMKESE